MKNPNHPNIPKSPKDPKVPKLPNSPNPPNTSRPGYEYLTCYQLGKVIQDLTDQFCKKFLNNPNDSNYPNKKLIDQMNGAARSNPQNIAEGHTHVSLKGYIYLSGIAAGSNEELAKDYQDFLRHRDLEVWQKDHPKVGVFREFRARWTSPSSLNTPLLPKNPQEAANMLLTFCQMESFLLDRLIISLKNKHKTEGGLTENLYKARKSHRGY